MTSSQLLRNYPLFGEYDANDNTIIDIDEWLDTSLGITRHPLNYDEFFQFMKSNARKVCQDPTESSDTDGLSTFFDLLGPISDLYFALDHDQNGQSSPSEFGNEFENVDTNNNEKVSRNEFNLSTE